MFFFKQKTAYEMRISYWSSDVCSSDLHLGGDRLQPHGRRPQGDAGMTAAPVLQIEGLTVCYRSGRRLLPAVQQFDRSEEHTSELQSLMRISYAVFCLKKKKQKRRHQQNVNKK